MQGAPSFAEDNHMRGPTRCVQLSVGCGLVHRMSMSGEIPKHKEAPGAPTPVVVVYCLVWRIAYRQPAPLAAGIDDEEYGLKDVESIMPAQGLTYWREDEPQHCL